MKISYLATSVADVLVGGGGSQARLLGIVVGTGAASAVVTCYNGTTSLGDTKVVIDAAAAGDYTFHGAEFGDGLYVKLTGGNAKVSVISK